MKFGWEVSAGDGITVEGFSRLVTFARREAGKIAGRFRGFLVRIGVEGVECICIFLAFGPRFGLSATGTRQADAPSDGRWWETAADAISNT